MTIGKDADGNPTITKGPSTEKEKWGRIAAAALTGAAQGFANSQGPGGLGKAAAAGVQAGMQMPQQRQDQVQKQLTADQKSMLFKANMAHLNQQAASSALDLKARNLKFSSDVADVLNKQAEITANSPGVQDMGVTESPQDAYKLHQTNPELMAAHPQGKVVVHPEVDGQGNVKGFHSYVIDPAYADQRNDKPLPMYSQVYNPDTKKFEPKQTGTIPVGGTTNGNYALNSQDFATKSAAITKNQADADKAEADANKPPTQKVPTNYEQAYGMAAQATDPAEKKKYTALGDDLFSKATRLKQTVAIKNVLPSNPDSTKNWGDLLSDPKSGVTLANVPAKQRGDVINAMKVANQQIAKPLTAAELNRSDLAGNALSNIEEAQRILTARPDLFGPGGWLKSKFRQALEGGDPDARAYQTAINLANLPALGIHGIRGKYALEDLSKLDSDLYTNKAAMANVLSEMHRSVDEFSNAGGRKIQTAPASGAGGGQSKTVPPGKYPHRTNGVIDGYADDPKGTNHVSF
jgi:hypothetical protein